MPDTLAVTLTPQDQAILRAFIQQAKANGRTLTRARVLLKASEGWSDADLVRAFDVDQTTVRRVRQRFQQGGLPAVLAEQHQTRRRQALTGEQAAHLIAIACTPAPAGHDHWTIRLLADKAVELGFVASIAKDTIHRLLKKTNSNPGDTSNGACPP
ncbi:MAG TPA: helix-turn-helix domain-containing protein [Ktedonobacterales bacterium]|jgi:transposase